MHKQSSCSEWANKPTKDKWKKPGRWGENMRSEVKKRKEPNQMESVANTATVWNGCSSQGRLPCLGVWIKCDDIGLGVWECVCVCVCVCMCGGVIGCGCVHARVCCAGGRIWHPVSKLACEGEGTLRFQGYFVFPLFLKNFSVFSTWFHFTHTCCFMEKKGTFLQIELSYSFSNVFFFLRKQKYAFFSLHLLSKQS